MGVSTPRAREPAASIPAQIKRNTLYLALSQALVGAGMQVPYTIGPLIVIALTGSASLSGLSIGLLGFSRFLVAYPLGRITDAYGRKPGLQLGLSCGLVGTLLVGLTILGGWFPLYLGALLLFGMGMSAIHQLRVAATDMYPPARRGQALGWVLTGSLVGVVFAPPLIMAAEAMGHHLGLEPLGLVWLFLPVLILPAMLLVALVRPDPKDIGAHLEDYYPGLRIERRAATDRTAPVSVRRFLGDFPIRVAIVSNFAAFGNMAIVMVVSTLVLAEHGHGLVPIAVAHALHSFGMFGFSLPFGKLTDRFGRRAVLLPGGVTATIGALLVVFTTDYWAITLGTFLVGFGWSAVNVAATVVVADRTRAGERGRAIGLNDSLGAVANTVVPLLVGPLMGTLGLPSMGILAVAMMVPALLMLGVLREPRPGTYVVAPAPPERL